MALLGGASIAMVGCAGRSELPGGPSPSEPPPSPPQPPALLTDKAGTISSNHGHVAVITAAMLSMAGDLILDIRGETLHTHSVMLTAAEVRGIAAGVRVSKESSGRTHTHTVTFN